MVNQLPAVNLLPFDIPDWAVLLFCLIVFAMTTVLDGTVSNNQFKDQVKPLKQASSILLVSLLAGAFVFIFSTNSPAPQEFKIACQYLAFFTFILGLILSIYKIMSFTKEDPEESQDIFEESLLEAQAVVVKANQIMLMPIAQLSSSELLRTLLRAQTERQEYLRNRIEKLKNRFKHRKEALRYLEEIVKQKTISREISINVINECGEILSDVMDIETIREDFRVQINFSIKILSISVKYGRRNALEKGFKSPPFPKLVLSKSVYVNAFQVAKQRIGQLAIQNGLPLEVIAQIDCRFDDLIQLWEERD